MAGRSGTTVSLPFWRFFDESVHRWQLVGLAVIRWLCAWRSEPPERPQPGPEHKLLQEIVGTWDCKIMMAGASRRIEGHFREQDGI